MEKEILLINNDFHEAIAIQKLLQDLSPNHSLHIVKTGKDALNILMGRSHTIRKPDLVLVSSALPDMKELELPGIIRNYYSLNTVKIFLLVSADTTTYELPLKKLMISGCLQTPFLDNPNNKHCLKLLNSELNPDKKMSRAMVFLSGTHIPFSRMIRRIRSFFSGRASVLLSSKAVLSSVAVTVISATAVTKNDHRPDKHLSTQLLQAPAAIAAQTGEENCDDEKQGSPDMEAKTAVPDRARKIAKTPVIMADTSNLSGDQKEQVSYARSPLHPVIKAVPDSLPE